MKSITKSIVFFACLFGAMFIANGAFAQETEKSSSVKSSSVSETPPAEKAHKCEPGCQKSCCASKASSSEGHNHGAEKTADSHACKPGCTMPCCASKSTSKAGDDGASAEKTSSSSAAHKCEPGCTKSCCAGKDKSSSGATDSKGSSSKK